MKSMHSDEEKSKLDLMAGGFLSLLWEKKKTNVNTYDKYLKMMHMFMMCVYA